MIVVIGATGNIGSKVVERLLAEREKVRAVARGKDRLAALAARGAETSAGSVEDPIFLAQAFAGADAVPAMIPTTLEAEGVGANQDRAGEAIARALRESA